MASVRHGLDSNPLRPSFDLACEREAHGHLIG